MGTQLRESHPDVWAEAVRHPSGLQFVRVRDEGRIELIVKLPAMFLLTARMNAGFQIHVAPVEHDGQSTIGLLSVFKEDNETPLMAWTPLFLEPASRTIIGTLLVSTSLTVRLVDEHDRELAAYEAALQVPLESRIRLQLATLLPMNHARAHALHESAQVWFNVHGEREAPGAINVEFKTPLYAETRRFRDERPELFRFHGSKGFAEVSLERVEPGQFQELDIILLLQRVFRPDQIFHAPLRDYDREEICDVLVITDTLCLVVQAKDSPNTKGTLDRSLERKVRKAQSQLEEGCKQVSGAIGYIVRTQPLKFLIDGREVILDLGGRQVLSLVVTRELFLWEYEAYSETLLSLHSDIELPCIALDYQELIQYCTFCPSEAEFLGAYFQVFDAALELSFFPRLRFGVNDLHDADGNFRFP